MAADTTEENERSVEAQLLVQINKRIQELDAQQKDLLNASHENPDAPLLDLLACLRELVDLATRSIDLTQEMLLESQDAVLIPLFLGHHRIRAKALVRYDVVLALAHRADITLGKLSE